jgi:hypothetical protein
MAAHPFGHGRQKLWRIYSLETANDQGRAVPGAGLNLFPAPLPRPSLDSCAKSTPRCSKEVA